MKNLVFLYTPQCKTQYSCILHNAILSVLVYPTMQGYATRFLLTTCEIKFDLSPKSTNILYVYYSFNALFGLKFKVVKANSLFKQIIFLGRF